MAFFQPSNGFATIASVFIIWSYVWAGQKSPSMFAAVVWRPRRKGRKKKKEGEEEGEKEERFVQ